MNNPGIQYKYLIEGMNVNGEKLNGNDGFLKYLNAIGSYAIKPKL